VFASHAWEYAPSVRTRLGLLAVALALVLGPAAATARPLRHTSVSHVRLRAFASCPQLVAYARRGLRISHGRSEPLVAPTAGTPPAGVTPGAPTATGAPTSSGTTSTPSYSTTNNQEAGVDEPDSVKTDGSTIFAVSQGTVYAIDATGTTPRLVGTLNLGAASYNAQLLLWGQRLIAISSGFPIALGAPTGGGVASPSPGRAATAVFPYYYGGQTIVTEIDVHKPTAMQVDRTLTVDGSFVDARQNGSTARLVISSQPTAIAYPALRARVKGWVPLMRFHSRLTGRRYARTVSPCSTITRPTQFSGLGMLTILTINLDQGLYATSSQSLMADALVVYGSQHNLYVATHKWIDPQTSPQRIPQSESTVIDQFDATDPLQTKYIASGEVPGFVLNQFSMSEYNGYLRVATTSRPIWWGSGPPQSLSQSYVTVLATNGSALIPVGQVSGLGAGQQIYSVRFIQNAGYVVTFRQVDPLYTIDLSSPTAPRVAGQLELAGYSSYLHPVGDGLLLGIGQDVGANNEPAGSQLELFDVSDPDAPKLLQRTSLGDGSSSEASYDHHAFLFWPATQLAVLPVQIYPTMPAGPPTPAPGQSGGASAGGSTTTGSPQSSFVGAIGFHVSPSGMSEVGRIAHDPLNGYPPLIHRALVIGDVLFTVSDGGIMASNLHTLAREAYVAFPQRAGSGNGVAPPAAGRR
jgi:uncharacterized secreted protein with C-terminal beta-propeller domain